MRVVANGEVYAPQPLGRVNIVISGGHIEAIGPIDPGSLAALDVEVIDANGCIVVPGLIDGHIHLLGGSGENGFASASAAIDGESILAAGITTVVGLLGTDTTTKTLPALLAKVKALRDSGLQTRMWTGGYDARSLTGNVRDDIVLIEEIIGAGEVAIADRRSSQFDAPSLARLAADCYVAGTLTGKAGVLHLHTGELPERLQLVRTLLEMGIPAATLHPTHVNRNEALFAEALELTRRGVSIDLDVVDHDLVPWIRAALAADADLSKLTISTDAPIGPVTNLLEQIIAVVHEKLLSLEEAFALATRNPARVLELSDCGEITAGKRADLLLLDASTLELRAVIACGKTV